MGQEASDREEIELLGVEGLGDVIFGIEELLLDRIKERLELEDLPGLGVGEIHELFRGAVDDFVELHTTPEQFEEYRKELHAG